MTSAKPGKAGFTLVELMIVVGIVTLLATIAIPNYIRARTQSQRNACVNNLRQIDDASQEWALEHYRGVAATVAFSDILPYLKGPVLCPASGSSATFATCYTLTTVSNKPICAIVPDTHVLMPDTLGAGGPAPGSP